VKHFFRASRYYERVGDYESAAESMRASVGIASSYHLGKALQMGDYEKRRVDSVIKSLPSPEKPNGPYALFSEADKKRMDSELSRLEEKVLRQGKHPKVVAVVGSIILLIVSILFLSPNLTGNVIGSLSFGASNILGMVLFVIGLVGLFFVMRK